MNELEELAGLQFDPDIVGYAIKTLRGLKHVEVNHSRVNQEIEKMSYVVKGRVYLPFCGPYLWLWHLRHKDK